MNSYEIELEIHTSFSLSVAWDTLLVKYIQDFYLAPVERRQLDTQGIQDLSKSQFA